MATTINVFGFLLLSLAKSCRAGAGLEPVCSKFEYEEKLLAKTMRLESKVDGLEDRVSGIESMLEALQQEKDNISAAQKKSCPLSYMYSQKLNLCWWHDKDPKLNWFAAEKHCRKEGGHLMIFNSTDTITFIQEYLRAAGVSTQVFIGGNDIEEEGVYMWNNGNSVQTSYIPWCNGEPTGNKDQNCMAIYKDFNFGDYTCGSLREFLCQIDLD